MRNAGAREGWRSAAICVLILVCACAAAMVQGVKATGDLHWPADPDFSRDIAAAEAIANGHPLSDPVYRNEWLWYNPLVPSLVAVTSRLSGAPIHTLYARLGTYINLLAPIGLFVLVAGWWGPWTGVIATLAFLFIVPGPEPGWLTGTYSPWLYPMHFAQGLFYLFLTLVSRAWQHRRVADFAWAGAATGVMLLTHTAPALLLGAVVAFEAVRREVFARGERPAYRGSAYAAFAAAGVVCASPLLVSILWHYKLRVQNPAPNMYVLPELLLENAGVFWRDALAPSVLGLVAVIGWVWLIRHRRHLHARIALVLGTAAAAMVAYSYVVQTEAGRAAGLIIPVPAHHFVYYLRAFESVAFALGSAAIARAAVRIPAGVWRVDPFRRTLLERYAVAATAAVMVVVAVVRYPAYTQRYDFVDARIGSQRMFADPVLRELYQWLRSSTTPDDVVLADVLMGQAVVGQAGRKLVVADKLFSNPYVDWNRRNADARAMDFALENGQWDQFLTIASRYGVRYVIRSHPLPSHLTTKGRLVLAWERGSWLVYRLDVSRSG